MGFTQKHADENKAMLDCALLLWKESDYRYDKIPKGEWLSTGWPYMIEFHESINTAMSVQFPQVPLNRVSRQVYSARYKYDSQCKADDGGFDSVEDMGNYLKLLNLNNRREFSLYREWQNNGGSKSGLINLLKDMGKIK